MMRERLQKAMSEHGYASRIIPYERLQDLKSDIDRFSNGETLTSFQEYVLGSMYRFCTGSLDWIPKSVVIIAVPCPACARVEFIWQGRHIHTLSLASSFPKGDDAVRTTERYMKHIGKAEGFRFASASDLPLKRLAVASGLAVYGRNNICYIEGMGSFFALVAYFTDIPCERDEWREVGMAERCHGCSACLAACPTGAIRQNRFLLNCERCLSFFNEQPGEFPEWLPATAHHCIYDCLKCQLACPMNADYVDNVAGPVRFSEDETNELLAGVSLDEMEPDLRGKVRLLGMDSWWAAVPRNLRVLFDRPA